MPPFWSSQTSKHLETGCLGLQAQQSPSHVQCPWKAPTLPFSLQDSLTALVLGQEPVYNRIQHGNNNFRVLEMSGVWFGWVFGVLFCFKLVALAVKKTVGLPAVLALINWAEFVVAYASVVSGVLTLKSCAVIPKIVKHKIQIPYLRISFHSSVFPFSPNPFLMCIATLLLHRPFFQGYLQEFCLFPWKAAYHFPRMFPNTLHLFCYFSLLWWCTSISVFELYDVDQIRFPEERK